MMCVASYNKFYKHVLLCASLKIRCKGEHILMFSYEAKRTVCRVTDLIVIQIKGINLNIFKLHTLKVHFVPQYTCKTHINKMLFQYTKNLSKMFCYGKFIEINEKYFNNTIRMMFYKKKKLHDQINKIEFAINNLQKYYDELV